MEGISCPQHPTANMIEDHRAGDLVCGECGLVVGDRLVDTGAEWRNFIDDSARGDHSRVGAAENPIFGGGNLSTMIRGSVCGGFEEDGSLTKMQQRVASSQDKNLSQGINAIREISDKMHLVSEIQEKAMNIFKEMHEGRKLLGKGVNVKAAACIYYACRLMKVPRLSQEISAASNVHGPDVMHTFTMIKTALDGGDTGGGGMVLGRITAADLLPRFCGHLGLSNAVLMKANQIVARAVDLQLLLGRTPSTIAAAAIYLATRGIRNPPTDDNVCEATGIAPGTLRTAYGDLLLNRGHLLD